jgi:hypothetical protein
MKRPPAGDSDKRQATTPIRGVVVIVAYVAGDKSQKCRQLSPMSPAERKCLRRRRFPPPAGGDKNKNVAIVVSRKTLATYTPTTRHPKMSPKRNFIARRAPLLRWGCTPQKRRTWSPTRPISRQPGGGGIGRQRACEVKSTKQKSVEAAR